jgi:uncharacterized membrane protein YhiD involved in acid resistance
MPEWLQDSFTVTSPISITQLAVRLLAAAVQGTCVAAIYRFSHGRPKADASVMTATLVLLSILIAMVSMVVGDSVARAFSLVGALSIVRFRTVVEDTRDTAFVIFAVIVGMAAGAGSIQVALVGIPIVGAVAIAMDRWHKGSSDLPTPVCALRVRLALGRDPAHVLDTVLKQHLSDFRLTAAETARQGVALDLHYRVRLQSSSAMAALVAQLNQVEGVQSVELRADA